jgi:hypothetical protein
MVNWFKILFPIIDVFLNISNEPTATEQISMNNQELSRKQFTKIRKKRMKNDQ